MTMNDAFTPYERGLREFQQRLGEQHERLLDFLNYEHQLCTNIQQARDDGETPILSADRNRIVRQLNTLALETVGISFNEMCGLGRREPVITIPIVELPTLVVLFFNLVAVIIIAFILSPSVSVSLPCVSPLASASSLAVIVLMLFHLSWRYLNPVIKATSGEIKVALLAAPIELLTKLADALHPYPSRLPDAVLWTLAVALSLATVILGLSPLSPFPPTEAPPIVRSFSVQFLERDKMTIYIKPGELFELVPSEQVLVQAETFGEAVPLCTWSAANGGLQPAAGCATLYSAPFHETYDVLDFRAQSPCRTQNACASLNIRVMPNNQ
jgi:hypothetical protein